MPIEQFYPPAEQALSHPFLRFVASRLKQGREAVFELYRPREALGYRKAKIVIHFYFNGQEEDYKSEDWDDDLNAGLIQLGVKARNADEEKDRFALGLRAGFKKAETRYGDGYFNSVLIRFVRSTDFKDHLEVDAVLGHIASNGPDERRVYQECLEMINGAISGRASELITGLKYEIAMAWEILAGAMARYLDERFSVTNRRLLGLL